MAYTMKGFSGFKSENSPIKQDVKVTTGFGEVADKNLQDKINKKTTSKVTKKSVSRSISAFANTPMQQASVGGKILSKFGGKILSRFVPGVGTALLLGDVIKTLPEIMDASIKGLKERAKSGNVNIGSKL
tara:strand:+ start:65 stop:454 length:390 start_codon:yes stop_codon:yes gene_type:complete